MHLKGRTYLRTLPGRQFHACYPEAIDLKASVAGHHSIRWSTGETTDTIRVEPGRSTFYPFTIEQNGFSCRDTAMVEVFRIPYNPFTMDSVFSCDARSMSFNARQPGYDLYYWRGGTGDLMGYGHIEKTDWLVATAEGFQNGYGCISSDSIYVRLLADSIRYYMFNGDGLFSDAANWSNSAISGYWGKPPTPLRPGDRIIIDTPGTCILDVDLTVTECGNIKIINNSQLILQRQLRITR